MRRGAGYNEEVNYWPSVSDMFLVFFILALCIVSTMTNNLNDGEKRIFDEVIYQSNVLFSRLELRDKYTAEMDSDTTNYPRLAEKLMVANGRLESLKNVPYLRDDDPKEDKQEAQKNYREAVKYLFRRVAKEEDLDCADNTDSARLLDMINRRLGGDGVLARAQQADMMREKLAANSEVDVDSLLKEYEELRSKIQSMVAAEKYNELDEKYNELSKNYNKLLNNSQNTAKIELEILKRRLAECVDEPGLTAFSNLEKLKGMLDAANKEIAQLKLANLEKLRVSQVVLDGNTVRYETNNPIPTGDSIATMFGRGDNYVVSNQPPVLLQTCSKVAEDLMKDDSLGIVIEIIGHTDGDSTEIEFDFSVSEEGESWSSGNAALGLKRARVMADLVAERIQALLKDKKLEEKKLREVLERLRFRCYSAAECYPLATGTTEEDKDKNRRIELLVRPMTADEKKQQQQNKK